MNELEAAIRKAKCTSPGKDKIKMTLIKHFPLYVRQVLLCIFNIIWLNTCIQTNIIILRFFFTILQMQFFHEYFLAN